MRRLPAALLVLLLPVCPAVAWQPRTPSPVLVAAEQGMPLPLVPVAPVQEVPLTPLTPSPPPPAPGTPAPGIPAHAVPSPAVPAQQEAPAVVAPVVPAQQAPAPPGPTSPVPAPQEQQAAPSSPDAPQEQPAVPPPPWLPRPTATLILLDKISAQPQTVTVPVGRSVTFESLTIGVQACDVHPPDVPAESTVLLDITDSHPGMPAFHGWIVATVPAASMFEHPLYDVRLSGCAG